MQAFRAPTLQKAYRSLLAMEQIDISKVSQNKERSFGGVRSSDHVLQEQSHRELAQRRSKHSRLVGGQSRSASVDVSHFPRMLPPMNKTKVPFGWHGGYVTRASGVCLVVVENQVHP